MQSGDGAPTISLQLVPKMLAPLASLWVPHAFVVSFKLETDESLLIVKARDSLNKYKHKVGRELCNCNFFRFRFRVLVLILQSSHPQLVIANVLQTRKHRVVFVTPTDSYELHLSREQTLQGLEIEEPIVADVVSNELNPLRAFFAPLKIPSFRCKSTASSSAMPSSVNDRCPCAVANNSISSSSIRFHIRNITICRSISTNRWLLATTTRMTMTTEPIWVWIGILMA